MTSFRILILSLVLVGCSSEKQQMETLRTLAIQDLSTQLQLPEGTVFHKETIEISEAKDVAEIEARYIVTCTIQSQSADGNEETRIYTLTYQKIGEGGLDPADYELISFE
ncbi:hypothetical protein [Altibacter sp.]|uniref:hypothetical protein n=1 Tax=Altibacter sp. TaxID=2024823 RepID=UPI00258BF6F9|nr:hypothetical protein [Altibacter sp.]MCW8981035.1 hypothetical protein [Altibacter sp.]MCW9038208.1 hypothetical protein [Altibacter sp.]